MRKCLLYLFFSFFLFESLAQCPFNSTQTFGGSANSNVSNLTLNTRSILYETMWGGEYYEITNVPAGAQYRFDFCEAPFDTYMTLFPSNSTTPLAFNDNFCGTGGTRSQLEYTFTTGGSYRIQLNEKTSGGNCGNGGTNAPLYVTLLYLPATATTINSIVRAASSPTNANSVSFTVTFAASITGLTASNFSLTTTGVSGASISSVTGSGTTWTVSVNTGTGDGTIKLNLANDTGLTPSLSNEPFDTGEVYTIDKAPPTIDITSTITSPTNVNPIPLTFMVSENITGFDVGDISVTNGSINNFSGSGANYTADLIPSTNGTISVTVNANSFNDLSGNANADPASFTIQYDNVSPSISGISRNNPTSQITALSAVAFRATFTETVTGVDISDFVLTTTGNVSGNIASITQLGGLFFTINVNNITGTGTIRVDLKNAGTGISDNSGNLIAGGFTSGQTYIINNEPSFVLTSPQSLIICQGSSAIDLGNVLRITDIDNAQNLTWSIVSNPLNGVLGGFDYTSTTNGSTVNPVGLSYTPNSIFVGNDNFTIRVSDGVATKDMLVNISVTASPSVSINPDRVVCVGDAINLTASGGGDYVWTGPNSFSSSLQNPTINTSTLLDGGVYNLTVTNMGCSATETTNVTVNPLPVISINPNRVVCVGDAINLTASGGGDYVWTGPNSFSSSVQNPTINTSTLLDAGVYTLTVANTGCSATETTNVTVNPLPTISINLDRVVCVGDAINLTASGGGDYVWTGPNSFSSSVQNPTINTSTLLDAGVYTLTVTNTGCSATETTNVTVNPLPVISINPNRIVCVGDAINLTASGGGDYVWTGPNSFSSSVQNPTINTSTLLDAGVYTLTVTNMGCSATETTNVTVNPLPTTPTANTQYVCSGGNLTLTATCTGGASPVWYLDAIGMSTTSPILNNITSNTTYYVACQLNNCLSSIIPQEVSINQVIPYTYSPDVPEEVYACENGEVLIPLNIEATTGLSFQWQINTGAGFSNISPSSTYDGTNTSTLKISAISLTMINYQYRAIISNACNSIESDTFKLAVNVTPSITTSPLGQVVCVGNRTIITTQASGTGISYLWQVDKGSGFEDLANDQNYENVNSPQLTIKDIPALFNNYSYRCRVYNSCFNIFTNTASLQVDPTITILAQPINKTVCQNNITHFSVSAVHIGGGSVTYQWQISYNGITYTNLTNSAVYQGVTSNILTINNAQTSLNNAKYRCVLNNYCRTIDAVLSVIPVVTISTNPANVTICQGNFASFTAAATGQGLTYRWQVNSGSGFVNIYDGGYYYQGATETTLRIYNALASMNGYQYRCVVSGTSICDVTTKETSAATLNISVGAEAQTIVAASQIATGNVIYQATEYVLGINKVLQPARADYRAGNAIILNPGFEVSAGAVFTAKVQNPCNLTSSSNLNLPKILTK